METVDCIGLPRSRGLAHGETLRDAIASALDRWQSATMQGLKDRAPRDIDAYCDTFLNSTTLIDTVARETPDLHAELAGIAEGADQPFARIAAYNLMDEQWWYDSTVPTPPPGCSLIALPVAEGHALIQNMDLPEHMEGGQVALRLAGPDMPGTVVLTSAGLVGLTGANDAGLAIGVNTLLMLAHASDGLPVAFAMRHALAAPTRDTARQRLAAARHASGQHYAMISRAGITALECSARSAAPLPVSPGTALLHTNHPLSNPDTDPTALARLENAGFNKSSRQRLDWLEARRTLLVDSEAAKALFDDANAPICMCAETHDGSSTFASVLYEMKDNPRVRMRVGRAGGHEWRDIRFL